MPVVVAVSAPPPSELSVDYEAVCESSLVYIFSSSICGVAAVALESTLPGETERGAAGEQPRKG